MGNNLSTSQHSGWRARAHQLWGFIRKRAQPDRQPVSIYRRITIFVASLVASSMLLGSLPAGYALLQAFDQQMQLRVQQASLATQALYEAERDASFKGISLVARRPALCDLIAQGSQPALASYLDTLRNDLPAQTLIVLPSANPAVVSGSNPPGNVEQRLAGRVLPFADFTALGVPATLVILAASPMENSQHCPATVITIQVLDSEFMHSLSARTGMQQSLIIGGQRSATSLPSAPGWSLNPGAARLVEQTLASCCVKAASQDQHYMLSLAPLLDRQNQLVALSEVALPTNAIQRQMQLILSLYAGSILLLALGSSLASATLTRRIIQPLRDLSAAAERIGSGDLEQPLPRQTGWLELDHLAARLDDSRQQLRSQYERSLLETRRFALLLNAVPAGIVTLDENGAITWLNPEAEQLLGCSLASALRRRYDEVFPAAPGAELTLAELLAKKEDTTIPCRLKLLDAHLRPITLAMTTAWLEGDQGSIFRREWVLVMRTASEDENVERLRARYLANLAHEFRTPLSSILASTELLADELADMDSAEAASLANAARLSTLHLQALVNNILESATIEAGAFQLRCRPVIFQEILQQAAQIMAPLLQRRGQWLEIDAPTAPITLWADSNRINQVFVNLIGNASKYGPKGAAIGIAVHADDMRLLVSICDSGPGFPSAQINNLFSRLFSPGAPPGFIQGIGLGLPIVKTIVQAHAGQVGAENRPEGGARIWFSLPLAEQALPDHIPPFQTERDASTHPSPH